MCPLEIFKPFYVTANSTLVGRCGARQLLWVRGQVGRPVEEALSSINSLSFGAALLRSAARVTQLSKFALLTSAPGGRERRGL
ncbi:hypothetical protein SKAU_G00258740 [Synaphobranchus kaupii]|uniref:Uncharacterized protein n=1 Tax=Synaphobranchus kaupii TaxID=118154 RepID=A0A9Q1F4A9_SYNKA|nr:hypothetical protein SKAU_G00258740 [Synaphobranchus kaupii]